MGVDLLEKTSPDKDSTKGIKIIEAPAWPSEDVVKGFSDDVDAGRLIHWGPMIAAAIIAFISSSTTHFLLMWWPVTTIGGFLHFSIYLFWNYLTASNMINASSNGPGRVPLGWTPPEKSHEDFLQYCTPCKGYKAPRSHHCSKCKRCSLKMDHHCPWINNCVGHRNQAWFVRFLVGAIVGCIHSAVIHCICFYHAIHISYYMKYGDGTEPVIEMNIWAAVALIGSFGFSCGVSIGLSVLLYMQIKYILKNRTGIEEYIDSKALARRDDDDDDEEAQWVYPYDIGWRRNLYEVLSTFSGHTLGNGIWWPVVASCDQYTLTSEQLRQKELKRSNARIVLIQDDFKGGVFGSIKFGLKVFCCQPWSEDPRIPVNKSEKWIVTRGQKHWLYGHKKGSEKTKGYFPRCIAQLLPEKPYEDTPSPQREVDTGVTEEEPSST
ncbi:unnamed protein product [Auanema sp. JU1783]|nr:unnamed protein product [Auanema sp. JU1783]